MAEEKKEQEFGDPKRQEDVLEIHDAVLREQELPEEGEERGPWWLYVIILATFAFGFFYMGFYFGEFSFRPHVLYTQPTTGQAEAPKEELTLVEQGERVYGRVCQTCHQSDGNGQEGVFPSLAGSPVVTGKPEKFAALIINGLQGELIRDGVTYNGNMPPWGDQLSDKEIAAVVSFVRTSFDNEAGEVEPQLVEQTRADLERTSQWTIEELNEHYQNN